MRELDIKIVHHTRKYTQNGDVFRLMQNKYVKSDATINRSTEFPKPWLSPTTP